MWQHKKIQEFSRDLKYHIMHISWNGVGYQKQHCLSILLQRSHCVYHNNKEGDRHADDYDDERLNVL